jgi:predicted O-methyltransferase YrrM
MKKWFEPSTPEEMPSEPWLNKAALAYLATITLPTSNVLEHGSGGSTLWFAKNAGHVTSIESDPEWYKEVLRRKTGAHLVLWDQRSLPKLDPPYDLLLIDGEPVENRILYLKEARRLVKPGGWVVLDNCNRPEYAEERAFLQKLAEQSTIFSTRIGLYLNTEFFRLRL